MLQIIITNIHRDCRGVLNKMVVTFKVSQSNSNDLDEFSWSWNAPDSVNKNFSTLP